MRFTGYIFDVEGTLVDSVPQNLLSLHETLSDAGLPVRYELLQLYSGLDGDHGMSLLAGADGPAAPALQPRSSRPRPAERPAMPAVPHG